MCKLIYFLIGLFIALKWIKVRSVSKDITETGVTIIIATIIAMVWPLYLAYKFLKKTDD
jgi:hypothetical protein